MYGIIILRLNISYSIDFCLYYSIYWNDFIFYSHEKKKKIKFTIKRKTGKKYDILSQIK